MFDELAEARQTHRSRMAAGRHSRDTGVLSFLLYSLGKVTTFQIGGSLPRASWAASLASPKV